MLFKKGEGGCMQEFALLGIGSIILFIVFIFCVEDNEPVRGFACAAGLIFMVSAFLFYDEKGMPKTEINAGTYALVGMTESTAKDKDQRLYMLLRDDKGIRLYSFAKDIILREKDAKSFGVLEVVESDGLKNATLRPAHPPY